MSDLYHAFANAIGAASHVCARFRTAGPSPSPPSSASTTTPSDPAPATPATPPRKATICASPSHFCTSPPKPTTTMPRTQAPYVQGQSAPEEDARAVTNAEPHLHNMHSPQASPPMKHHPDLDPGAIHAMADMHPRRRHRFRPLSRDSLTSPPTPASCTSSSCHFTFDPPESQEDMCASQPEPPDTPPSSQHRPPSVSDHIATMKIDYDPFIGIHSDSSAGPSPSPQRALTSERTLLAQASLPSANHTSRHISSPLSKASRQPHCTPCGLSPVPKLQRSSASVPSSKQRPHMPTKLRQKPVRRSRSRSRSVVAVRSPRASPRPFTAERDWSVADVGNMAVARPSRPSSVPATPLPHATGATPCTATSSAAEHVGKGEDGRHGRHDSGDEPCNALHSGADSAVARRLFSSGCSSARPASAASCLDGHPLPMSIPEESEDGRAAPSPDRTRLGCPDSPASITSRVSSPPVPLQRSRSSPVTGSSLFTQLFAGAFELQHQQTTLRQRRRGLSVSALGDESQMPDRPVLPEEEEEEEVYVTAAHAGSNDVFSPETTPTTTAPATPAVTSTGMDMDVEPCVVQRSCYPEITLCSPSTPPSHPIDAHLGMPCVATASANSPPHRHLSMDASHAAPNMNDPLWQQQAEGAIVPGPRPHGNHARRQRHSVSCPADVQAPESNDPLVLPWYHFNKPGFAISPETLCHVLEGGYRQHYDELHIVDCRFDYEFEGGHIQGAINLWRRDDLLRFFMRPDVVRSGRANVRTLVVLHCEFSSERAPAQFNCLRGVDRSLNHENYPHLLFPEVYILDGGYSSFNKRFPHHCTNNGGYTPMKELAFSQRWRECETELHSQRRENHVDTAGMAAMLRRASLGGTPFARASSVPGGPARLRGSRHHHTQPPLLP